MGLKNVAEIRVVSDLGLKWAVFMIARISREIEEINPHNCVDVKRA